jgi:hypothetical protein
MSKAFTDEEEAKWRRCEEEGGREGGGVEISRMRVVTPASC